MNRSISSIFVISLLTILFYIPPIYSTQEDPSNIRIQVFTTGESSQFPIEQIRPETPTQNCEPIELQYDIEYGNVESICYDKETVSLLLEVTSELGASKITVHIPKTMIFSVDQECNSAGDIIVLLNEEDTESPRLTISETNSERIATLILPESFNTVEFIGTYTLGRPNPLDICGSIHGYDTQYIPPLKQWKFGVDPTEVKCNKGMELVFKQIGNDPACIKTTHIEKFLTRGKDIWSKDFQCVPCE